MPTDESYLDNLLKGLTSDAGEKEEDRLSAYRRRHDGEIKDSYDRRDIPGFLNDYIDEDKSPKFNVEPEPEEIDGGFGFTEEHSYFEDDEEQRDNEGFGQDADDTIENYNIFEDDIDDSLIDEMIASELSEETNPGKPFGVSENVQDDFSGLGLDDYSEADNEGNSLEESFNTTEELYGKENGEVEQTSEKTTDIFEEQPAAGAAEEADMLADVFGNLSGEAEDTSNVTIISNGDEVSMIDKNELDSLFDTDEPVTEPDTSNVETADTQAETADTQDETPADEWVIDNSVEEIPAEQEIVDIDGEGELADIFSGGSEPQQPQSLEDIEGLEGLSSDDISSLNGLFSELEDETEENKAKKEAAKEKVPFLLKLFGNKPIPPDKIKPEPTEEEIAAKKAADAEQKKAKKEEKKKAADEKKKAAAEAKALKAKQSAEEKEAAKAKKREQMEKLLLDDVGNTQKLNLAGCIVIFAMFAAIAALVISGISTASYNASIKEAEKDFNQALIEKNPDLYTEAYNQLYGLEIKDKDKILEDKVYTVQFVNSDITAFNNHYAMGDKTTALRDLLQGVMVYNFYIDHAYELEIEDHLLYLRSILIGLLESEYGISEEEAVQVIHNYDDTEKKLGELSANRYLTMYILEKVKDINSQK